MSSFTSKLAWISADHAGRAGMSPVLPESRCGSASQGTSFLGSSFCRFFTRVPDDMEELCHPLRRGCNSRTPSLSPPPPRPCAIRLQDTAALVFTHGKYLLKVNMVQVLELSSSPYRIMCEISCQVFLIWTRRMGSRGGEGEYGPDVSSALKKDALNIYSSPHPPSHVNTHLAPQTAGYNFSTWIQKDEVDGGQSRWTSGEENSRSLCVRLTWVTQHCVPLKLYCAPL